MDEVKRVLVSKTRKNTEEGLLSMVDSIQRLGIDYYFEEEIEAALKRNHMMLEIQQGNGYDGLSEIALQFRMLRQQGYYVPTG